jgi:hypothetical protein
MPGLQGRQDATPAPLSMAWWVPAGQAVQVSAPGLEYTPVPQDSHVWFIVREARVPGSHGVQLKSLSSPEAYWRSLPVVHTHPEILPPPVPVEFAGQGEQLVDPLQAQWLTGQGWHELSPTRVNVPSGQGVHSPPVFSVPPAQTEQLAVPWKGATE